MKNSEKSQEIIRLLREVMILWKHNIGKIYENSGLTVPQGTVLTILSKSGKMKIHDLSEKVWMNDSTMSGIIDRLEKQGLVERLRSQEDKRVVFVSITEKFNKTYPDFHDSMASSFISKFSKGSNEELESVTQAMTILKRLMSE